MTKDEMREFMSKVRVPDDLRTRIEADCIAGDDGYYVYWPTNPQGYLSEYYLLIIAAILHDKNLEWDNQIDEYFANQR